ncbi:MBL fold metallo-hydrolase [Chloroflexota bacterium]
MTEIVPGIYQLQLPLPESLRSRFKKRDTPPRRSFLDYVNVYLIEGDDGYLLVDTGWNTEEAFEALKDQMAQLHIDVEDISQIFITHIHLDHCGMAGRLKQISKATIAMHQIEKNMIGSSYGPSSRLLQQTKLWMETNGVPAEELNRLRETSSGSLKFETPSLPDVVLQGGETIKQGIFNLEVIWTPGHSPGHLCLYEPAQKTLFAGDHVLPMTTPNIGLYSQSILNPLGDYLKSLSRINKLDVNLILPGHEDTFTDLQKRVDELFKHHEQRKAEIIKILKAVPKTAYQTCLGMVWFVKSTNDGLHGYDLGTNNKRMALLETISHLEAMRLEGSLEKFSEDGVTLYRVI